MSTLVYAKVNSAESTDAVKSDLAKNFKDYIKKNAWAVAVTAAMSTANPAAAAEMMCER